MKFIIITIAVVVFCFLVLLTYDDIALKNQSMKRDAFLSKLSENIMLFNNGDNNALKLIFKDLDSKEHFKSMSVITEICSIDKNIFNAEIENKIVDHYRVLEKRNYSSKRQKFRCSVRMNSIINTLSNFKIQTMKTYLFLLEINNEMSYIRSEFATEALLKTNYIDKKSFIKFYTKKKMFNLKYSNARFEEFVERFSEDARYKDLMNQVDDKITKTENHKP